MASLRRALRRRKALRIAILVIAFVLIDVAFGLYISSSSTAEMPSDQIVFSNDIRDVDRSAMGFVYVFEGQQVTRIAGSASNSYSTGSAPTSIEVGLQSDALAVSLANDSVILFRSERTQMEWSRSLNGTPILIAMSERGTQVGQNPDRIFVLTENATAKALVGLSALRRGSEVLHWPFQANVTDVAHSDNTYYIALAFDNSTVAIFDKSGTSPLGFIHLPGEVLEIEFSSSGSRMATLYRDGSGCKIAIHSIPSLASVALGGFPSSIGHNLRLHGDFAPVYIQLEDSIYRWEMGGQGGFEEFLTVEGLEDYVFPSVMEELFTSSPGSISAHVTGMVVAKWDSPIGGGAPSLQTDAGGWMVLGYDTNRLLIVDNTRDLSGSKELWTVFGTVLILQSLSLFVFIYWKRLKTFNSRSVIPLAGGAMAGIMVTAVFPDQLYMEWMGDPLTYLLVSATVAGIVSLIAWEGQAGLGGVVLGTVLGIPLAMGLSLVAAFIIWVLGHQFPGNEEIFMTLVYSLPMGFKMGLSGSVTGALLSRFYRQKS